MKTLVIAAHLDDEVLSTGGLIRKRVREHGGDAVHVLVLHGRRYDGKMNLEQHERQMDHAENARQLLGYFRFSSFGYIEGEPGEVGYYRLLKVVERILKQAQPTEVVIPGRSDLNQDHRHLNEVCRIALRPGNRHGIHRILEALAHDTLDGPQEANYAVNMDRRECATVITAMSCYEDEVRKPPHPRSPQNMMARWQLYGSQFGVEFAEPYRMVAALD